MTAPEDEEFSPADLWTLGPVSARLDRIRGHTGRYTMGFLDTASHMAEEMARNQYSIDVTIYPTLYLLRHGLELGFKAILETYDKEHSTTKSRITHSLDTLWNELKPQLVSVKDYGLQDYVSAPGLKYISDVVGVLHAVDPNGEAARYETDSRRAATLSNIEAVNLWVLRQICKRSEIWVTFIMSHRLQLVANIP